MYLPALGLKLVIFIAVLFLVPLYFLRTGPEITASGPPKALVTERDRLIAHGDMVNAYHAMQDVRLRIQFYYDDHAELPLTLADLGLERGPVDRRGVIRSIRLEDHAVVADLNPNGYLPAGRLTQIPNVEEETGRIRWRCVTGDFETIGQIIRTCEYQPSNE